jgi:hypothetical protein
MNVENNQEVVTETNPPTPAFALDKDEESMLEEFGVLMAAEYYVHDF